ncbi:putative membrane protein YccC [Paraburkholderia sp. CI2]|uniref:FUSC family protein n=1 Tax=Paraburkholderia sp. CI2 TaxID=2723093 RepID=UPI001616EB5E|nr:FUSC family protein [Paraburkholderia sp. CI2]MBB5464974.1 putative membrane protein YccC [Paraburkholderia sp. CI2]
MVSVPFVQNTLRWLAASRALRHVPLTDALRGGIICTVPAVLAAILHAPLLSWSAIAAFWTCFADSGGRRRTRLAFAMSFGLAGSLASGVASWSGEWPVLAVVLAAAVGFAGAFARVGGPRIGLSGLLVATAFGVSTAFPGHDFVHATRYAAYFLYGNLWAIGFGVLLWRGDHYAPVRRGVAACFAEMADLAFELSQCTATSRADGVTSADARGATRARVRTRLEAVRDTVLIVSQGQPSARACASQAIELATTAEQTFVALVALDHLLAPDVVPVMPHRARALVSTVFAETAELLKEIALCCKSACPTLRGEIRQRLVSLDAAIGRLQARTSGLFAVPHEQFDVATLAAVVSRVRSAIGRAQALLRASGADGSAVTLTDGNEQSSWRSFSRQLSANLNADSSWFRYALRVALASATSVCLVLYFRPGHGYWLILTTFFTMQPNFASTLKISAHRVGGTVIGAMLAAALGFFIHSPLWLAILVFPLSVGTLAGRAVNYIVYTLFLTPHFILVAELGQPGGSELTLALMRMANSVAGAALGVAISLLVWPHWERHRIAHVVATAIETSARYVTQALWAAAAGADSDVLLAGLRRQACIATDQMEASMGRMRIEPNAGVRWDMDDKTVVAALRRTIGAATLLELSVDPAGLSSSAQTMGAFAQWVEDEMAWSAALLRGESSATDNSGKRGPPPLLDDSITLSMRHALQRISSGVETLRESAERDGRSSKARIAVA